MTIASTWTMIWILTRVIEAYNIAKAMMAERAKGMVTK